MDQTEKMIYLPQAKLWSIASYKVYCLCNTFVIVLCNTATYLLFRRTYNVPRVAKNILRFMYFRANRRCLRYAISITVHLPLSYGLLSSSIKPPCMQFGRNFVKLTPLFGIFLLSFLF